MEPSKFIFAVVGIVLLCSHCQCVSAFMLYTQTQFPRVSTKQHQFLMRREAEDHEDKNDMELETKESPMSLADLSRLEEEASRKNLERLLLPDRIGQAVTKVAWLFVLSGFVLNIFGYGYVVQANHLIKIDTLENRQFQMEVRKSIREDARQQMMEIERK